MGMTETSSQERQETEVRIRALEAGIARLRELESEYTSPLHWEIAGRLMAEYQQRIDHLRGHVSAMDGDESPENFIDHRLQKEALAGELKAISALRAAGKIPDDIFRNIQYDLDLATVRLT
jgi:hypothetical protein